MAVNQDIIYVGDRFRYMNIYANMSGGLLLSIADDPPVKFRYFGITENTSYIDC